MFNAGQTKMLCTGTISGTPPPQKKEATGLMGREEGADPRIPRWIYH